MSEATPETLQKNRTNYPKPLLLLRPTSQQTADSRAEASVFFFWSPADSAAAAAAAAAPADAAAADAATHHPGPLESATAGVKFTSGPSQVCN